MKSVQNTALCLGLLTAPIKIYAAASDDAEIHFSSCGPQGEEVSRVYVKKGSDPVEVIKHDSLGKSYEGRMISKTVLANVEEACLTDEDGNDLKQINIESFVPLKDVPMDRAKGLYYIGPNLKAGSAKSLETLKAAMKKKKVAAVAKVVLRSRQKLFVLFVKDDILYAVALSFHATINLREDSALIAADVEVKKAEVDMACQLIDVNMENVEIIDQVEDTFVARKRELVEASLDGKEVEVTEKTPNASDGLLDALQASVDAASKKTKVKA